MKRITLLLLALLAGASLKALDAQEARAQNRYFMTVPATQWFEALPIGNGRIGALLHAQPKQEIIVLNESSVWFEPQPQPLNPNGPKILKRIREMLFDGQYLAAEKMAESDFLQGRSAVSPYQPLAFLRLNFEGAGEATDYRRGLRMNEGVAYTTYKLDGATYTRESFISYDSDIGLFTFASDTPGSLTFTLTADRLDQAVKTTLIPPNKLRLSGSAGKDGVKFEMLLSIQLKGGKLVAHGQGYRIEGADHVSLRLAAATNYNFKKPASPLTRKLSQVTDTALRNASKRSDEELLQAQQKTFGELFSRSYINLQSLEPPRPLNEVLPEAKARRTFSNDFLMTYSDFCKYLLISASRPGGLPANLQGIWNPLMAPNWESDWHNDINLSMFYWPACAWGLPELAEPIASLAEMAFPANKQIAQQMLGVREGSFMTTCTDAWGHTAPFRHTFWGLYVSGGAWILQDALRPWYTTRDPALLKRMLPLLREQTLFYMNWCVRNPTTNKWVSGPSVSPENSYRAEGGRIAIDMGPTHDQELIYATLTAYIDAATQFAPKDRTLPRAKAFLQSLAMPEIAPDGSLQEWSKPFEEVEPGHRHLSHTYGLVPGRRLSARRTPELAQAIRKTIAKRNASGYNVMGWAIGLLSNLYTRLEDGNAALATIDRAVIFLCPNLFTTAHETAPQVSDMCGVPAALNEMLLQSDGELIELLPALPDRLHPEGSFKLQGERGFLIEAAWRDGKVTSLTLTSKLGGECKLRYNGELHTLTTRPGEVLHLLKPAP